MLFKNRDGLSDDDVFIYTKVSDSTRSTAGRDLIKDFQRGHDLIDLKGIDADTEDFLGANNSFDFIGSHFDSLGLTG